MGWSVLILLLTLSSSAMSEKCTGDATVKVMNYGDSITLGVDFYPTSVPGGYRIEEAKQMEDAHIKGRAKKVEFVGPFEEPEGYFHAGFNAATIEGMARNVYKIVKESRPNVVTLQAGTNDFFFSSFKGYRRRWCARAP